MTKSRLLIILTIPLLVVECKAIRIRGFGERFSEFVYDPRYPALKRLICEDDNGTELADVVWKRENGRIDTRLVINGTGQLLLSLCMGVSPYYSLCTRAGRTPRLSFEDRYHCEQNGKRSPPLSLYVVPSPMYTTAARQGPIRRQLQGNVTIVCPLLFGYLQEDWIVMWVVHDNHYNYFPASRFKMQLKDNTFQLVINNVSLDYDETTFICRAEIPVPGYKDWHGVVTLKLFWEPEMLSHPNNPIIVNFTHGIAEFVIKAYPRPIIEFIYNNTYHIASSGDTFSRIQIVTNHLNEGLVHTASFMISNMKEEDNRNVTLRVEKNLISTVMLFLPYKLELTRNNSASTITSASTINRNNSASTNSQVYLLISLRRPLYFDYDIEFVDNIKETVLDTMEGTKGATRLSHTLPVRKGTEVMARFQIGGVRGPNSNPVAVDEQNLGNAENHYTVLYIVVAMLLTIVLLVAIAAITYVLTTGI